MSLEVRFLRRGLIVWLAVAVLAALLATPAGAAKRDSRGPKPYKSEEVTIRLGHLHAPGLAGHPLGVTANDFLSSCEVPGSNGFDGWVYEIPAPYRKIASDIQTESTNPVARWIDIFLYDKSCNLKAAFYTSGPEASGMVPRGVRYVLIVNWYPTLDTKVSFTLDPH
jgi:hypothetical protein